MKFLLFLLGVLLVGLGAQASESSSMGRTSTAENVVNSSEKKSNDAKVTGASKGGDVSSGDNNEEVDVQAFAKIEPDSASDTSSADKVAQQAVETPEKFIWLNLVPYLFPKPIFTDIIRDVESLSNPAAFQLASLPEPEAGKEGVEAECEPGSSSPNPLKSLFALLKDMFRGDDFSFWSAPRVHPHIDENFCIYEVDFKDIPDSANVVVGVDGSVVTVAVADTITQVKKIEVPGFEVTALTSEECNTAAADEVAPENVKSDEEKKPENNEAEQSSEKRGLRGSGLHMTHSHSHSSMHFTLNQVCDQNSPDAKASLNQKKLFIKMPVKKDEAGKVEHPADTQDKDEAGKVEHPADTQDKDEAGKIEHPADTQDKDEAGKVEHPADTEQGSSPSEKRILPLVKFDDF